MIKVRRFPQMIIFDILNICNLHCFHCPQKEIIKRKDFKPIFLDFGLFKKIIDEIANYKVDLIRFTGDGEPLLHKYILKMIEYAKAKVQGKVNLTTNGLLLDTKTIKSLLQFPIDFIDISIDAYSEEKYNLIRKGGNFKKLMSNIHQLIKLKAELHSPAKIMVNMINQELAKDEIDKFREYWTPLVDYVLVRNLHSVNNYLNTEIKIKNNKNRYPCPHLYKRMTIDFLGNIKFCAHDWYNNSIIGNLKSDSIKQIWNSPKYKIYRFYHEHNEFGKIPICRNCQDWKSVPWDYGYDKVIKKVSKHI